MAFGDNMKESYDPSSKHNPESPAFMDSLLNDENPECIETNQKSIHEERIRNAPQIVKDYYAGKVNHFEKGLFRVLVAKKSNRIIFFIMLFCLVIVFINGNISHRDSLKVINGYECELNSFAYDDKVFASIKIHPVAKTKKKLEKMEVPEGKEVYFPVKIDVYGITKSGVQIKFEEIPQGKIFYEQQIFRTSSVDCDIITVACNVKISDKQEELSVKVSRNLQ